MARGPKPDSINHKPIDPPFAKDIRNFVQTILDANETVPSYTLFKERWKEARFSRIHEAKSDDVTAAEFIQELYCCCLGYLVVRHSFNVQVIVIYMYVSYNKCLLTTKTIHSLPDTTYTTKNEN
jgi:hypothetical protein